MATYNYANVLVWAMPGSFLISPAYLIVLQYNRSSIHHAGKTGAGCAIHDKIGLLPSVFFLCILLLALHNSFICAYDCGTCCYSGDDAKDHRRESVGSEVTAGVVLCRSREL